MISKRGSHLFQQWKRYTSVLLCLALGISISLGCGKKSKQKSDGSGVSDSGSVSNFFKMPPIGRLNTAGTFQAATPRGLLKTNATALQSSDFSPDLACDEITGGATRGSTEHRGCLATLEIRDRFFIKEGPAIIADRLKDFDGRLNGTLENM